MKYPTLNSIAGVLTLLFASLAFVSTAHAQRLVVSDPNGHARLPEVIQLPLDEVRGQVKEFDNKVAIDAATHKTLTTQMYSTPEDPALQFLLIAVALPASGRMEIDFVPANGAATPEPLVFGREAPERKDDFAWENKMVAFRVYGPALEAAGEITSGIDVWSKRVPNFVIDSFYKHDAEGTRTHNPALSYHKDDGVGLDSFLVGPTRGCGGTGVISNGKLWVSKNYTRFNLLSNGPVRFEFELTYAPWDAKGTQVTETKRITLDAGSHLNRIKSTFTFAGDGTIDAAAGLAIHSGADFHPLDGGQILSVWDTPQDPSAGRIATGIIQLPGQKTTTAQIDSQALLEFPIHSGQSFTYLAGSGWSKADMPTPQAWDSYLQQELQQAARPLKIRWEKTHRQ